MNAAFQSDADLSRPDRRPVSLMDAVHVFALMPAYDGSGGELRHGRLVARLYADSASLLSALDDGPEPDVVVIAGALLAHEIVSRLLADLRRRHAALPVVLLNGQPALDGQDMQAHASRLLDRALLGAGGAGVGLGRATAPEPGASSPSAIIRGDVAVHSDTGRVLWKDRDVGLTLCEYKVVHLLASNSATFMAYRAIYDVMHYPGFNAGGGSEGYRQNVRATIKRIRAKFRQFDAGFEQIETYSAFGYRWRST